MADISKFDTMNSNVAGHKRNSGTLPKDQAGVMADGWASTGKTNVRLQSGRQRGAWDQRLVGGVDGIGLRLPRQPRKNIQQRTEQFCVLSCMYDASVND